MIHTKPLITLVTALSLCTPPAMAQPPAAPPAGEPVIRVDVNEVLVDIIVRDRRGRVITDLKPGEIVVSEDNVKQETTGFRLIQGRDAIDASQQTQRLDPLRQIRLVSLVFERLNADAMRLAREAANELVKRETESNVYFAVFRLQPNVVVVQEFTRDKDLLKKAIERASSSMTADPRQSVQQTRELVQTPAQTGPAAAGAGGDFAAQAMDRAVNQIQASIDQMVSQFQGTMSLTSLLTLMKAQQKLAGRKTAVYFAEGLWLDQNTEPIFDNLVGEANRMNFTIYAVDVRGLTTWSTGSQGGQDLISDVGRAREAVGRSGGAATAADMSATDRRINAQRRNQQQNMSDLAESTGGFLIADTNDFRKPMARVVEDIWSYYEVAYRPANKNFDGSLRKLTVEVKRPDIVVQARNGYFALPPEFRDVLFPWEVPLLKAIAASPMPTELGIESEVFRFGHQQGLWRGVLDIEVPLSSFQVARDETARTFQANFSLISLLKDTKGQVVRKFQKDIPYAAPLDRLDMFKAGNFTFAEPFVAAPGNYTLESAVLDRLTGKIGATKKPVVLPSVAAGPVLSSLAMIRRVDPVDTPDTTGDPFRFDKGKVTPELNARIVSGPNAVINIYCVIFTAGGPKPQLFLEFASGGQALGKLEAPGLGDPDKSGRISYIATIPAANFPVGDYVVTGTLVQAGKESGGEKVAFSIVEK